MYWGLTTIFQYFQVRLERRLSKGYVRGTAGVGPCAVGRLMSGFRRRIARRPRRGPQEVVRGPRGAVRDRPRGRRRRGGRDLRPVGVRQEHPPAVHQLPRGADVGLDRGRRHPGRGRAPSHARDARADPAAPHPRRDGVPGLQPVPAPDRPRERDRGPGHRARHVTARGASAAAASSSSSSAWPRRPTSTRSSSPAASSSAWRSHERSR